MNMTRDTTVAGNPTRVSWLKFLNRHPQQRTTTTLLSGTSPNSIFGSTEERQRHSEGKQEMENRARARLRVLKKKAINRSGKKMLLKKLVDYLKSDTFMYATLVSPLPSEFLSTDTLPSSAKVVELKKPIKQSEWILGQVGEYLESDVYMYAPLVDLPHSLQEPLQHNKMIRMNVSTRKLTMKVIQPTDHLGNMNQRTESHLPQTDLSDQHSRLQKETVTHTVYQSCHSTSASRKVTLNSQLRARS